MDHHGRRMRQREQPHSSLGAFSKIIIPLALVGYDIVISNARL